MFSFHLQDKKGVTVKVFRFPCRSRPRGRRRPRKGDAASSPRHLRGNFPVDMEARRMINLDVTEKVRSGAIRARAFLSRGCSSVGRALGWQPRGQGFDPPQLHHDFRGRTLKSGPFFPSTLRRGRPVPERPGILPPRTRFTRTGTAAFQGPPCRPYLLDFQGISSTEFFWTFKGLFAKIRYHAIHNKCHPFPSPFTRSHASPPPPGPLFQAGSAG